MYFGWAGRRGGSRGGREGREGRGAKEAMVQVATVPAPSTSPYLRTAVHII